MKFFKSISILFFLFNLKVFAQSTTFEIEQLMPPSTFINENSQQEIIKQFRAKNEKALFPKDSLVFFDEHAFLKGILTAYQEHRPFVISPDIIWLLICQGFAAHVNFNSEELRKMFVNFDGKKELLVTINDTSFYLGNPNNNWEQLFPQFTNQIGEYTGIELTDNLTADFSTTNPTSKIASQITIMESMKSYFDYKVNMMGCGIPKITIEGSIEDWEKILAKTKFISKYELDWWTSKVIPIIEEIILAKKGKVKKNFWMNMVKAHTIKGYGSNVKIDGWIVKFFPYSENGKKLKLNSIIGINSLTPEIVRVPFILEDKINHKSYKMEFWSGFLGLSQNKNDFTLKPEIGWMVNYEKLKIIKNSNLKLK